MMAAHLSGDIKQVEIGTTIFNLVKDLDIAHKKIALEINGEIIPHSQFESRILQDGDQIEIVTAVGGG
jgi:sulfur carrier protein